MREHAHQLVNRLDPGRLAAVVHLLEAFLDEEPPCGTRLADADLREVHVRPAGEAILEVPTTLPVSQEYEFVHKNTLSIRDRVSKTIRIIHR